MKCLWSDWFGLLHLVSQGLAIIPERSGVLEEVASCFVRQHLPLSKGLDSMEKTGLAGLQCNDSLVQQSLYGRRVVFIARYVSCQSTYTVSVLSSFFT